MKIHTHVHYTVVRRICFLRLNKTSNSAIDVSLVVARNAFAHKGGSRINFDAIRNHRFRRFGRWSRSRVAQHSRNAIIRDSNATPPFLGGVGSRNTTCLRLIHLTDVSAPLAFVNRSLRDGMRNIAEADDTPEEALQST